MGNYNIKIKFNFSKCKKLCQITNNLEWKKNRNLHIICLLDMVINNNFEQPYNKFAPEGSIPVLSKTLVKSRLSQKFWKITQKIYEDMEQQKKNEEQGVPYQQPQKEPVEKSNTNTQKLRAKKNIASQEDNNEQAKQPSNDEIESMKILIKRLQNELEKKDEIIRKQKLEKEKLMLRMEDLEKMLASFLVNFFYNFYYRL